MKKSHPYFSAANRGLTMVEVIVAMVVFGILMTSILSALVYSHRTAQESICQNAAFSNTRAMLEQVLRGVSFNDMPYTDASNALFTGTGTASDATDLTKRSIQIEVNGNIISNLYVSLGDLPNLTTLTPGGAAPTGTLETVTEVDINNTPGFVADDLQLKVWLWVKDASVPAVEATQVRAVTLIYHWRFKDGNQARWHVGVLRTMRSSAPTF